MPSSGNRFEITATRLSGLCVVTRQRLGDERGFLERLFCDEQLGAVLTGREVSQVNHTFTEGEGSVRGMHFQLAPHAECKLVSCLQGEVFDVAVDVRRGSPTFLQWHGVVLSESNGKALFIPEGFAHGFQVLGGAARLLYLHTARHAPESESGIHPLDPLVGIEWPHEVRNLSVKDQGRMMLDSAFRGIET